MADAGAAGAVPRDVKKTPDAADDEAEMGGEAPCQLHRFWDVDE